RLGESVTEGTVTRWLKQEGERVEADEPLLEVSTDKVDTEIPSPAAGVLAKIVVHEDETAEVGSELAVIAGEGEGQAGGTATAQAAAAPAAAPAQEAPADAQQAEPADQAEPAGQSGAAEPAGAAEQSPATEAAEQPAAGAPSTEAAQAQPAPQAAGAGAAAPAQAEATGGGPTTVVTMPALGESVTEGTVTRWLKQVGETVEADEPLLEVSTDKVDTEIPAPAGGTLLEIKVAEDETAPVGAELAVIGAASGAAPADTAAPTPAPAQPVPQQAEEEQPAAEPSRAAEPAPRPAEAATPPPSPPQSAPVQPAATQQPAQPTTAQQPAQPAATQQPAPAPARTAQEAPAPAAAAAEGQAARPAPPAGEDGAGYVTPLVRKLASEHGVELTAVKGTGVGGRIRKQDVLEAADRERAEAAARTAAPAAQPAEAQPAQAAPAVKPEPSPLRGTTEKMSRMRALIARRMVESLQVSAQLTTVVEVDVSRIARLRDRAKADFLARHGVKLSFLPFFALAAVEALRIHPKVNASIDVDAGTVTYHDAEHLGIAVDTERGLMVPVIHSAGDLNLSGLAKRIADLADRTRTNRISPDDLAGGTFTLTNTGSRGALFDTPIINQPQVAILGTGAVVKRAAIVEDRNLGEVVVPRSMVYLALSYDHRLVDGADAARFLNTIKDRLEAGNFEAELGLS
ncbi:MAG TPA: 2-oxoglutarate dehydrogenase, E2 component, dihydrolipoamide succinyltransferase, partial [Micromonosporaceae bacterium]|nr:2-oxoglutarate dehydrogenase, E2 component, dihydrolipoamide succinyltransferase [Micromonosporaceae bacterium]